MITISNTYYEQNIGLATHQDSCRVRIQVAPKQLQATEKSHEKSKIIYGTFMLIEPFELLSAV